jgi:hypothetical protein
MCNAIPGYQEIHGVHGCDGNMGSVGSSLARDLAGGQNASSQFRHLRHDIQQGKILEHLEAFTRRDGVSCTCFVNDEL